MDTAKEVGGDFYDCFMIDSNRLCILIADVSGKGMPAALFMMRGTTVIKDYALIRNSTSEIFTAANARLCENNDEDMFITAWIGILDTRMMTLQYTNAGHNYPVLLRRGPSCEPVKKRMDCSLPGSIPWNTGKASSSSSQETASSSIPMVSPRPTTRLTPNTARTG